MKIKLNETDVITIAYGGNPYFSLDIIGPRLSDILSKNSKLKFTLVSLGPVAVTIKYDPQVGVFLTEESKREIREKLDKMKVPMDFDLYYFTDDFSAMIIIPILAGKYIDEENIKYLVYDKDKFIAGTYTVSVEDFNIIILEKDKDTFKIKEPPLETLNLKIKNDYYPVISYKVVLVEGENLEAEPDEYTEESLSTEALDEFTKNKLRSIGRSVFRNQPIVVLEKNLSPEASDLFTFILENHSRKLVDDGWYPVFLPYGIPLDPGDYFYHMVIRRNNRSYFEIITSKEKKGALIRQAGAASTTILYDAIVKMIMDGNIDLFNKKLIVGESVVLSKVDQGKYVIDGIVDLDTAMEMFHNRDDRLMLDMKTFMNTLATTEHLSFTVNKNGKVVILNNETGKKINIKTFIDVINNPYAPHRGIKNMYPLFRDRAIAEENGIYAFAFLGSPRYLFVSMSVKKLNQHVWNTVKETLNIHRAVSWISIVIDTIEEDKELVYNTIRNIAGHLEMKATKLKVKQED